MKIYRCDIDTHNEHVALYIKAKTLANAKKYFNRMKIGGNVTKIVIEVPWIGY